MEGERKQDLPDWMVTVLAIWTAISLIGRIWPETKPAFCETEWYKISMSILTLGFFVWLIVSPKYRFNYWWWTAVILIALWLLLVGYTLLTNNI